MTEYTTSSQAFQEYMSARERTARWLQGVGGDAQLYSPSVPPSVLDGLVPSSPPSDADSSHSSPPKMILRYGDGRPDVPIPHSGGHRPGSKRHHTSQSLSYNQEPSRSRSGSSADTPSYASHSRRYDNPQAPPEEIRILPTFGDGPPSSSSSRPSHTRSKSLSRAHHRGPHEEPAVPFLPPHRYPRASAPQPPPHQPSFAPPPQWPPRHGSHAKHPPAIVYAPPQHSQRSHYAPPPMFHHQPQMGPNGMMYSHSAPVPGQYPPAHPTGAPYPHAHAASAHDVRMDPARRDRMRALGGRNTRLSPTASSESLESRKSGSTYYVLPAHGQKVHVISPSPDLVVPPPSSAKGAHSGGRKPFFQRIFNFKKFSHAGSSHDSSESRKLHRRHSLTGGHHSRGSSEDS